MDIKHIEELARVMRENDLTALEVQEGDAAIKLERKQEIAAALAAAMPAQRASSPFAPWICRQPSSSCQLYNVVTHFPS